MKNFIKNLNFKNVNRIVIFYILNLVEILKETRIKNKINKFNKKNNKIITSFCNFVKKKLNNNIFDSNKIILMDCCNIPSYIITNLILSSEIKKILKANIYTFDINPRDQNMDKIMSSFNSKHLIVKLKYKQKQELRRLFITISKKLKNSNDLYKLKINNISIGIDIYETILKNRNPTVIFGNLEMFKTFYLALKYYIYFNDLFKQKRISALCLSDNSYIGTGIITKLAYRYLVPVFHANEREINRTEKEFQLHSRFKSYNKYFQNLNKTEKQKATSKSKQLLKLRLSGKTKVKMFYQEKSAFTHKFIKRQLHQTKKIKIIITTHCFYDNPSAYGGLLFKDFYEWLIFIGKTTKLLNYEIYIKPHRDYLPGTIETLEKIENIFDHFKIINPETTFHQLKKEGAKIILTGYGSVGHELPILGFLVINAGYNPHYNYNFNIHPKNLNHYKKILMNLKKYKSNVNLNKIYEFFYVHYILNHRDNFFFQSNEKYMRYVNYRLKSFNCYSFFLKNSNNYLGKYKKQIKDSILSNRCFSVESNLPINLQQKLKKTNLSNLIKNDI